MVYKLPVNIGITSALILVLLIYYLVVIKKMKKNEENITHLKIVFSYLGYLLLFLVALGYGTFIWGFDLKGYIVDIVDQAGEFLLYRIGAHTILKITLSIVNYAVKIFGILAILSVWGINVLPALAGLGILGLVVGLGAQDLIKDFISGFFIIFEKHFDVGDMVEINGFKGEVIDIGLKTTRVMNWKKDVKIFNNSSVQNAINYSLTESIAIVDFGVAYEENIDEILSILKTELPGTKERIPAIVEDPVCVGVVELASSSVNLRVVAKTKTEQHYGVERELKKEIKKILDSHDIEIPFPQVVVSQKK